jgi:hypothetical protein
MIKKPIMLACKDCGSAVRNISKYAKRFLRRHPALCLRHKRLHTELAKGVKSVEFEFETKGDVASRGA